MKLLNIILLFLFVFSFLNKIESYYLKLENDNYSYENICNPTFIFVLPTSTDATISSFSSTVIGSIGKSKIYSDSENTVYRFDTSLSFGSVYNGIDIVMTTISADTLTFNSDLQYNCIQPPTSLIYSISDKLLVGDNLSILYFSLILKNIEKPIKQFTIENANSNPYIGSYVSDALDKNSARFKLVYNYSTISTSPTPQKLQFTIGYGLTGTTIQLEFDSPISVYQSTFCSPIISRTTKISSNFWDSSYSNYFQCDPSIEQQSLKLFLISKYTTGDDEFQTFKMAYGNGIDGAVYMLTSSYQELNRPTISNVFNSFIYNDDFVPGVDGVSTSYADLYPTALFPLNANNIILTSSPPSNGLVITQFSFQTLFPYKFDMNYQVATDSSFPAFSKLTYPYGITGGTALGFKFSVSKTIQPTLDSDIGLSYITFIPGVTETSYTAISTTTDVTPPIIVKIEVYYPRGGNGNYAVLSAHITDDLSGFSYMKYGDNLITATDLIGGDSFNGFYEKTIIVTFTTECIISDRADNIRSFDKNNDIYSAIGPDSTNMELKRVPFISAIDSAADKDGLNVTMFKFENYEVNHPGFLQRLFFDYQGSALDIPVQFHLINPFYDESQVDPMKLENQFYKDVELDQFIIDFYIPIGQCTGNLDYLMIINGKRYGMDYFASQFQQYANLSVISSNCDETPPQIVTCDYIQNVNESGYVNFATITEFKTVGWRVQIKDVGNGLLSAYFKVVSNLDPLGYDFYFAPSNASSGDKSFGFYDIVFNIGGEYPEQTFCIINAVLVDEGGQKSELIYDLNPYNQKHTAPISPLMEQQDNFFSQHRSFTTLTLNDGSDTVPPTLQHFEVIGGFVELDVGKNPFNEISFYFQIADTISLSLRHVPIVYLDYHLNYGQSDKLTRIECESTIGDKEMSGSVILSANYTAVCQVPYGWSNTQGHFSVSLYGIVDSSLNINGFTSLDLKNLGYPSIIDTVFSMKPIIRDHTIISSVGGTFTIYGSNLGDSQLQLNYEYEGIIYSITTFIHLSNSMIVVQLPNLPNNNTNSMLLSIVNLATNFVSNPIIVTIVQVPIPTPTISPTPTINPTNPPIKVPCLNNCGGPLQGTCIKDIGCHCISPFTGIDCRSGSVILPPPKPNTTSPIVNNNIPNFQYSSISSIVAIREISFDGIVINSHYFDHWNFSTISTNKYLYSTEIIKNQTNVSTINATLEWFEKEAVIEFAESNITINPSSLKYTISVNKYPFSSKLNTMEIIFKSQFTSSDSNDICSSKQNGLNDGVDYSLLSIGDFSFYSKFVKTAIIDSKIISIDNHNVDSEFSSDKESFNNVFSYTAIKIPNYNISAIVDPDFSLLFNHDEVGSDSDNSICNNSSKKSLTPPQIAGIIVGGVAFLFILTILIVMLISPTKRISVKIFFYRLKQRSFK